MQVDVNPFSLLLSVFAMFFLARLSTVARTNNQPNRSKAFLSAAGAAMVLTVNGVMHYLNLTVIDPMVIAVTAFILFGVTGFYLVRAALKGEAVQIKQAAARQAEEFKRKNERTNENSDK
jgi:multisubunit Na+/H+ antiporter MnhG subunit